MILIALGANLRSAVGPPRATLEAALVELAAAGVRVPARSSWYATAPVPPSDQPDFVNGVARIETPLGPADLLALLLQVEAAFGRVRQERGSARTLDLDLLAHGDTLTWGTAREAGMPELPHPRLHERAFVLVPLTEIAPDWRHPALGRTARELLEVLGSPRLRRLEG